MLLCFEAQLNYSRRFLLGTMMPKHSIQSSQNLLSGQYNCAGHYSLKLIIFICNSSFHFHHFSSLFHSMKMFDVSCLQRKVRPSTLQLLSWSLTESKLKPTVQASSTLAWQFISSSSVQSFFGNLQRDQNNSNRRFCVISRSHPLPCTIVIIRSPINDILPLVSVISIPI